MEAFAVLLQNARVVRSVSKKSLRPRLADPNVYTPFLKHCAQEDGYSYKASAKNFKKGLYLVLQAIGLNKIEKKTGISRVTLYRMFSKTGNPSLENLLRVYSALGLRFWIVDIDFIFSGGASKRYKFEKPDMRMHQELMKLQEEGLK